MAMPKIELRLQMFRGDWDQIWSQMRLLWAMEGLCRINQTHLRQMELFKQRGLIEKGYPPLYLSGMHYETEKGTEIWPDIPSMLMGTMGEGIYPGPWGDCEDFSCYRVAEYRELPWHYERPYPGQKGKTEYADPRFPQQGLKTTDTSGHVDRRLQALENSMSGDSPADMLAFLKDSRSPVLPDDPKLWVGWKKVKGGIKAKPFAKWRRGPQGNYHYHALVLMPDGRLEDPSLVLGMGREREFSESDMAEKMRKGLEPVVLRYAKKPEVMVVDPEKPSGYAGGKAPAMDKKVIDLINKGQAPEGVDATLGEGELGAFLANEIPLGDGEFDVDQMIGWSRAEKCFDVKNEAQETRRLLGYAKH